jgi:hypothetical protein
MPISYEIDRSRSLIRTTCAGAVRLAEVLDHFGELEHVPNRPARLDVLLDLTTLETPPDADQLRMVAERIGWRPAVAFGRCAVVVSSDALYGVARMFGTFAGDHFTDFNVFRARADAEAWLDLHRGPAEPGAPG